MPIAIRSFEQAIALDPDYTLAYAGLADCHSVSRINGWVSEARSRPPAEAALNRAMALDLMLPEVQFSQGVFIFYFEPAWLQAEPYFRRALELNPRSSMAHVYCGYFLAVAYRYEEASAQVNVALDLDPQSPFVHTLGAFVPALAGAYPEAEYLARRVLDLQPDYLFGLAVLAGVLAGSGRVAEAIPIAERAVSLSRAPNFLGLLGFMYSLAGRTDDLTRLEHEVEERHSRGEYITPVSRVALAMARNDSALIRPALEDCLADNAPFASLRGIGGRFLDAWRTDSAIDELLLRLGDGVRPPSRMNTGS
jgi:tetratricopeptide (TPR) repeat protein